MNSNNQPDYLSKKRTYSKHYDERGRDRERDRSNERDRMLEGTSYSFHKIQSHQLRDYPNEDLYSHNQKQDYKRKEQHYIGKEPKEIPKKKYSDVEPREYRELRSPSSRKRDDDSKYNQREKRLYSYILLPRNYYKYITKNFGRLCDELHDRINDISDIQYDYSIPHFHEYVFRYSTETITSRALAIRIISEYLFNEMRDNFQNMTYLKVSILIPDHVIGFIIGIEGKNINRIRDETGAKIEVYQKNSSKRFRQIELSGSPRSIARASEKIYSIALKYLNFNHESRNSHSRSPSPYESKHRSNHSRSYKHRYPSEYHLKDHENDYEKKRSFSYLNNPMPQQCFNEQNSKKEEEGEAEMSLQQKMFQSQPQKDYSRSSSSSEPRPSHKTMDSVPILPTPQKTTSNSTLIPEELNQPQLPTPYLLSSSPGLLSSGDLSKMFKKANELGETTKDKCSLEVLFSSTSMNVLKQCKSNIWIDLENNYHCSVSKRTQKSLNDDISIITFNGTPEENALALYQLQKYLIDSSYSSKTSN